MILGGIRANLKSCIDKITLDLQRLGADIQTKVEELEELNQSLRQRDKVKMMLYLNYQINLCRYQQGCRKLREDRLQERAP